MLLCEPYFTGSHRAWAAGLARHSRHEVRLATHAGGFWKWRMQGAALTLAEEVEALVDDVGRPDVLLVSDMVNLPALLGFARRALHGVPVVLYLHENQLTYPLPAGAPVDHTYAMTNWLSMAAADRVVFNSEFHRRELLDELPRLLRRFPDHRHVGRVPEVAARSTVLPVGVDLGAGRRRGAPGRERAPGGPPLVLWNHRWDYDKGPAEFFRALEDVAAAGVAFRVAVAGQSAHRVPEAFEQGRARLGDRVAHFGTAAPAEYRALLTGADVVVSTALHEFFGVAVVEAVAAGALPLLPDRLAYPELVPEPRPYLYGGHDDLVASLRWALSHHEERAEAAARAREYVQRFDWSAVAPRYDALLSDVAAGATGGEGGVGATTPPGANRTVSPLPSATAPSRASARTRPSPPGRAGPGPAPGPRR